MKFEDVIIRPFEASDTVKLSDIWLEASLLAHPFIGESRLMDQLALIEKQYLPSAETWVATLDGEPASFISLLDTFIGGLFVSPCRHLRRHITADSAPLKTLRFRRPWKL